MCVLCSLQRDRALIRDLLAEVERYSTRNLKEREGKAELERRRQHEAQHAQQVASQKSREEMQQFTAGGSLGEQVLNTCIYMYVCVHVHRMCACYIALYDSMRVYMYVYVQVNV